jgi:DDE superfamily endonuclease
MWSAEVFLRAKKKFGVNMQACCDADRRFLDVSIGHPGATSDYLAYETSPLHHQINELHILKPGLCLYGDNAYPNSLTVATPFKGVSAGDKDSYNYYHSQLRINIECALVCWFIALVFCESHYRRTSR